MRKQLKSIVIFILFVILSLKNYAQSPKLIEFGWDYPDVDQLSHNLSAMQNSPFDGICFSLQRTIMDAFDTIVLNENYFQYEKLKTLKWGKYTDNYIILRGFGAIGSRWKDDRAWKIFSQNMSALSLALQTGRIKGIIFDPEYYFEDPMRNPWTYTKVQYPDESFEEVELIVKNRGAQFIKALQKYKPDLSFISIWLSSMIAEERKTKPIQETRHVLLLSFIEGMLEGKKKQVKIIDGNESAYWHTRPSQFVESVELLKNTSIEFMKSKKAKLEAAKIDIGQSVYYDGPLARTAGFNLGLADSTKWKWLEGNINYAMAASNSIVWFYSERNDWWKNNVNDTLFKILQNSKAAFTPIAQSKNKKRGSLKPVYFNSPVLNEGKGYFYTDPNNPMKTGNVAFSIKWEAASKNLKIELTEKKPATITVFANNIPFKINAPKKSTINVKLDKFKKGTIIIVAKYDPPLEAAGIQLYD